MPYVLPYQPTRRDKLYDALIEALPQIALAVATKGMSSIANIPNPGYGQTGSPGTSFSMAGANQNPLAPPSTARYQAPTAGAPYATKPMLNARQFDQLIKNQQYQKNAYEMSPQSPENLLKGKQAQYWGTLSDLATKEASPQPTTPTPGSVPYKSTSPFLQALIQKGDSSSMDKLRLLAIEKNDPEAIAYLQSIGEL